MRKLAVEMATLDEETYSGDSADLNTALPIGPVGRDQAVRGKQARTDGTGSAGTPRGVASTGHVANSVDSSDLKSRRDIAHFWIARSHGFRSSCSLQLPFVVAGEPLRTMPTQQQHVSQYDNVMKHALADQSYSLRVLYDLSLIHISEPTRPY